MPYKSSASSVLVFVHTPRNSHVSTGLPSIDAPSATQLGGAGRTHLALGAGSRVPPRAPRGWLPVDQGGVCCRSRLLLATFPGTGRAFRHLIGRNCPCRPRPLEAAGARGRGGSPRSPDRARWAAELGAGRRTGAGRAGGRGGRAGGSGRGKGLEGGVRCRGWCRAASPESSPGFVPAGAARRQHLSTLAPPLSSSGRAGLRRRGTRSRRGAPISCQASGGAAEGGERHTKNAVRGAAKRGGNFGTATPGRARPPVPPPPPPPVRGRGDNTAELTCQRPRSPGPSWTGPRSPSPLPPAPPAPARERGAPSLSRPVEEVGPRGRRARQLASREKFAASRRGGGARPPPLAPTVPAGDFLGSPSARAAARTAGTAGRPEPSEGSAPGPAGELAPGAVGRGGAGHLGLRRRRAESRWHFFLEPAGGTNEKCEGSRGAGMPLTREPYPWEPSGSGAAEGGPEREGGGGGGGEEKLEGRAPAPPATDWLRLTLGK